MQRGVSWRLAALALMNVVAAAACSAAGAATSSQALPPGAASAHPSSSAADGGRITWRVINSKSTPQPDGPSDLDPNVDIDPNATLEGWQGGYVEFMWHPTSLSITPWTSTDAVHWSPGDAIDAAALWGQELRAETDAAQETVGPCTFRVTGWADDGAALLMRGRLECALGCGAYWQSTELLFASEGGSAWTPRDEKRVFGSAGLGKVSGGEAGFAALGVAGGAQVVWTSRNGLDWQQHAVPADLTSKGSRVGDPASIAGGLVLPGAERTSGVAGGAAPPDYRPGPSEVNTGPDCSDGGAGTVNLPAVYWSPDGSSWTAESLPGAVTAPNVYVTLTRLDDRALVATEDYFSGNQWRTVCWLSSDGRTWNPLSGTAWPIEDWPVLEGADRAFLVDQVQGVQVAALTDALRVVSLAPEGEVPPSDDVTCYQVAVGPAGILVTLDGKTLRLGVVH